MKGLMAENGEVERQARPGTNGGSWRRRVASCGLAVGLYLLQLQVADGEDHLDYRFAYYQEENGRIRVGTQSWMVEKKVTPWLTLQGEMVYDAISGATPTGAPPGADIHNPFPFPLPGQDNKNVPTAYMSDERWAGVLNAPLTFGPHHITPQFSYSTEHDYTSYGAALNYSLDLNQKNTSLNLGWAHDWDTIYPYKGTYIYSPQSKNADDLLIGINQLLGPKTVLTLNFTFRDARGYLADPYRGVLFSDYIQFDLNNPVLFPEKRPDHRHAYIGYVSLTQYVKPLRASVEGSYRLYVDTYDIVAHTVDLRWHQNIGKHVMISPMFRYYEQEAASFYATQFPGNPADSSNPTPIPPYYSADYRLSHMQTFTYGVAVSVKVINQVSVDFSYERYAMYGLDHVTSPSAYPKANIFTVGARLWF
jgi:hypothetical protein